jgi:stage II sporulation protein D
MSLLSSAACSGASSKKYRRAILTKAALARSLTLLASLSLLLPLGCSKMGMTPNPGGGAPKKLSASDAEDKHSAWGESRSAPSQSVVRTRDIDFARAFEEEGAPRDTAKPPARKPPIPAAHSLRYPSIKAQRRPVRVLLKRGVAEAVAYSAASAQVYTPDGSMGFRGRMHIDATFGPSNTVTATVNNVKKDLRLPCTLYVNSATNLLELGENSYRGAVIIVSDGANTVSLINALHVEDYLRGVVPLEIGSLSETELEALKAQTITARTYTYKKMSQNDDKPFDLASTVADQVYGGANAEAPTPDMAIRATKDLILAYNDEIVNAYYHSTCGGKTANVEDVWGGVDHPYLRSKSDLDKSGKAYCSQGGTAFKWIESWSMSQLSNTIKQHAEEGNLSPRYGGGTLRRIEVRERFECGRVKTVAIVTSAGQYATNGEKARSVLRRNASQQLLRSSNFNSASIANGEITISGTGYGHGVGMCQVGAIARSRAGENFEQILRAYYTDISVRTVVDNK